MPTTETPAREEKTVTADKAPAATSPAVKLRTPDGRVIEEPLTATVQMRLYSRMVHEGQVGLVEVIGGKRTDEGFAFPKRANPSHFGVSGDEAEFVKLVTGWRDSGHEVFTTPAALSAPEPLNDAVGESRCVWVDIDEPENVDRLREFPYPPHLVVESGGSGGVHAYWKLDQPINPDALEAANAKLAGKLGGDPKSVNRARIMRVPGTFNYKPALVGKDLGRARIRMVDFARPEYAVDVLTDGLEDPREPKMSKADIEERRAAIQKRYGGDKSNWVDQVKDSFESMPPTTYFMLITGEAIRSSGGQIICPNPNHSEKHPSCYVYPDPGRGHWCHGCGEAGFDAVSLKSVLMFGRPRVNGDDFLRVVAELAPLVGVDVPDEVKGLTR